MGASVLAIIVCYDNSDCISHIKDKRYVASFPVIFIHFLQVLCFVQANKLRPAISAFVGLRLLSGVDRILV